MDDWMLPSMARSLTTTFSAAAAIQYPPEHAWPLTNAVIGFLPRVVDSLRKSAATGYFFARRVNIRQERFQPRLIQHHPEVAPSVSYVFGPSIPVIQLSRSMSGPST